MYVFHQMVASETKKDFKELLEHLSEKKWLELGQIASEIIPLIGKFTVTKINYKLKRRGVFQY